MAVLEQFPLSGGAFVLASAVVCAGTALQTATGVGLGLLAGPILILTLEGQTAIFVAILLNLIVSLLLLPQERAEIIWPPLRLLALGSLLGIPLGWYLLSQMDAATLKLTAALVVLAAGLQMMFAGKAPGAPGEAQQRPLFTVFGGSVSGIMSGCLAIPGPIALWTLVQQRHSPRLIRATLRALFVFSYGAAFIIHFAIGDALAGSSRNGGWIILAALLPAVALGLLLGGFLKKHIAETILLNLFKVMLVAMGVSLIWKGLGHA